MWWWWFVSLTLTNLLSMIACVSVSAWVVDKGAIEAKIIWQSRVFVVIICLRNCIACWISIHCFWLVEVMMWLTLSLIVFDFAERRKNEGEGKKKNERRKLFLTMASLTKNIFPLSSLEKANLSCRRSKLSQSAYITLEPYKEAEGIFEFWSSQENKVDKAGRDV